MMPAVTIFADGRVKPGQARAATTALPTTKDAAAAARRGAGRGTRVSSQV